MGGEGSGRKPDVIKSMKAQEQFIQTMPAETIELPNYSGLQAVKKTDPAVGGAVDSVFTRTGDVVAATNDYTWAQVNKTTSDIADITTKAHTSLTSIGTNTHAQIDTHMLSGSGVHGLASTSDVVGTAATQTLTNKSIAETQLTFTDITTGNATTTAHGYMPKGTGSTTTFYRSDLTQAEPPAGSETDPIFTSLSGGIAVGGDTTGTVSSIQVDHVNIASIGTRTHAQLDTHMLSGSNVHALVSGSVVGTTETQTLTNKTFALGSNTLTGTSGSFNTALTDSNFYMVDSTDVAIADGGTGQSTKLAAMDALSPTTTAGDLLIDDGTNVVRLARGSDNQVLTSTATTINWEAAGGGMTESAEASSTPVSDTAEAAMNAAIRFGNMVTLPTTEKFYRITAIEWKNGATVSGNVIGLVFLTDADPPVSVNHILVAQTAATAQSGTSAVQKVSVANQNIALAGGAKIVGAFIVDNGTGLFRYGDISSSNTYKLYTYNADVPVFNTIAWGATAQRVYMKVYYRGYS